MPVSMHATSDSARWASRVSGERRAKPAACAPSHSRSAATVHYPTYIIGTGAVGRNAGAVRRGRATVAVRAVSPGSCWPSVSVSQSGQLPAVGPSIAQQISIVGS